MSWFISLGIALLTGIAALFGAGTVASLLVDWYNVSSFEGGSGYFVVGNALLGLIGGGVIGLIVARVEAREARPRFVRALGIAAGAVAGLLAAIAAVSWMLADIPPRIDGEELFLRTEIRWPAAGATAPQALNGTPYLRIGAVRGSTVRRMESGPLFVTDARQEDGRWIVPGVVPIFTSRGGRLLDMGAGDASIAGFVLPLPRYPGEAERRWSEWLPHARPGEAPLPDQFTYRYKVVRASEPIRTERLGALEIDTIARYFFNVGGSDQMAANATFRIRYDGEPLPNVPESPSVAVLADAPPALLVTLPNAENGALCAVLADVGGALRTQTVRGCGMPLTPRLLTSDPGRFAAAQARVQIPGWLDRRTFAEPGLYQLDAAILDTRTFETASFLFPDTTRPDTTVAPLTLSPDEQSFVWLAQDMGEGPPQLGVTNWRTNRSYLLPIDPARMRYPSDAALDPAWVAHHFTWQREGDTDVLVQRPDFVPLPYRGQVSLAAPGAYQSYTLQPAGTALRAALVELLVRDLRGERLPDDAGGFTQRVRVNGISLGISVLGTPSYVSVAMDRDDSDPQAMRTLAAALDAALVSGRYDSLFVSDPPP